MSFITKTVMPIAAAGAGGESYWIAEYDPGNTTYSGDPTNFNGGHWIEEDNSGTVGLIGVSNEWYSNASSDRVFFMNIDPSTGAGSNLKVWRPAGSYLTQDRYWNRCQYDKSIGKWVCVVQTGQWYLSNGNSTSRPIVYFLNDDGTVSSEFSNSSMRDMAYSMCPLTGITSSGSGVCDILTSNGDTIYYYKIDPAGGTTGRLTVGYEAQDSNNWQNNRGIIASPNGNRFASINYNSSGYETSVSFHPAGGTSLSYYSRKVPGSHQGSGYDTDNSRNLFGHDVGFTGGANTYNVYMGTYYNSQSRFHAIRINDSGTYYYCQWSKRTDYNSTQSNFRTNPKNFIAEATGDYVYGVNVVTWNSFQQEALVITKYNKSDMSVDSQIAIKCERGVSTYNQTFNQQNAFNVSLSRDETALYVGGTTADNDAYWGEEVMYAWRIPVDFSTINFGTYGDWKIWDFSSTTTGGTLPVQSELIDKNVGTSSTYNRSLSITNSASGNYMDDVNDSYYENNGQSKSVSTSKTDIA